MLLAGGVALVLALRVSSAEAQQQSAGPPPGRVLVIRGVFNVFSLGLDDLACKLAQQGYQVDVAPPELALLAAHSIQQQWRTDPARGPLVLIGHSLGGRFCCSIPWKWRESGIPVKLAVILDSNPQTAVSDNVQRCVNLYVTNDLGLFHGQQVRAVDRHTSLVNLDMTKVTRPPGVPPLDHFNIDDSAWIHQLVIEEVDRAMGVGPGPDARAARWPAPRRPRVWSEQAGSTAQESGGSAVARAVPPHTLQPARR